MEGLSALIVGLIILLIYLIAVYGFVDESIFWRILLFVGIILIAIGIGFLILRAPIPKVTL